MRKGIMIASVLMLLAVPAAGDTVYTRTGKIYKGAATRMGNKVLVQTADGKTIQLPAAEVLHISKGPSGVVVVPPEGGGPVKAVPRPPAANAVEPPVPPTRKHFSISAANEPEPVVFMLMRQLAAPGASSVLDARRQLERWRALAHDRKRRCGAKWLSAKEIAKHRETYVRLLAEAKEAERKAKENMRKYRGGGSYGRYRSRHDTDRLPQAAVNKLRTAVNSWPDMLLRGFLTGVLHYDTGSHAQAAAAFRNCCAEAPRVAGFYQGYGLALTKINQHKQALPAYVRVVRLRPEEKDAVELLREGFGSVPGGLAASLKSYAEADELLSQYEEPKKTGGSSYRRYSSRSISWLMPGRDWRASRGTLPVPPYDRLSFRQCIAVAVGKTKLVLDASVVADAEEVFVQIDPKTVVPADVSRSRSSSRGKEAPVSLSLATVEGYTFTPLPFHEDKPPAKGRKIVAFGLGLYEEMGSVARLIPGEVKSVDDEGEVKVTLRLAAGEVTSPVLGTDGELLGFLAGKLDVKHDGGGRHRFVPVKKVASILKQASRTSSRSYSRAKRKIKPAVAQGSAFIVYATVAERFR